MNIHPKSMNLIYLNIFESPANLDIIWILCVYNVCLIKCILNKYVINFTKSQKL